VLSPISNTSQYRKIREIKKKEEKAKTWGGGIFVSCVLLRKCEKRKTTVLYILLPESK
jgi:hypothetical protein